MRVVFGPGSLAELPAELDDLGLGRALVLATPGRRAWAGRVADLLGRRAAGVHAGAVEHVPAAVADAGVAAARSAGADSLVAIGGGSAIGLAKAVALRDGLPIVAVPTTYSGSEMTPVWGLTENGAKRTGRDPVVLPRSVVYDPELTHDLPRALSVVSAVNALAHAAETLYAPDGSPVTALLAAEAARALADGLRRLDSDGAGARTRLLYGAWLAGSCLGGITMGLHHKLCHTLGGALDLPHAPTHTVLLPYVLAFNAPAAPDAMRTLAGALQERDAAAGGAAAAVRALTGPLGAPSSLRELGAERDALPAVARAAAASPYGNPRPASEADIAALLDRAWTGSDPAGK